MKQLLLPLCFLPALLPAQGMWMPQLLEKQNEKEMQALGLKLDADDLYSPTQPSVKDAICQLGGCTAEVISPQGLLLTNHHCGLDAVQSLSTMEHNYVEDGFWAKTLAEELPCAGLTATFISRIEDVTALALIGVTDLMDERSRQAQIEKNIAQIKSNTKKEKWEELLVKPFYAGNQFFLFVTVTYTDIRFVGAPPASIGKFGADTDNWVWPRHTGDFSLLRVYAGADNHPAPYSTGNVPLKPRHFLPISLDGVQEGDFTMVYGFPGTTNEYLPAAGVQQTAEVLDSVRVAVRDQALKIMDDFMRRDSSVDLAYISRQSGIANSWKKWLGEMQGLKTYRALEKKRAYEAEFTRRIQLDKDWSYKYGNVLPRLEEHYKTLQPYVRAREFFLETLVRDNELFGQVSNAQAWIESYEKSGENAFASKIRQVRGEMEEFYKDYHPEVDQAINTALLEMLGKNLPDAWGAAPLKAAAAEHGGYAGLTDFLFKNSAFASRQKMLALLDEKPANVYQTLKNDPAYQLWKSISDAYAAQVQPKLSELQPSISLLQRQYMAAQMAVFKENRFFPDANSTLRVTYGKVRGYSPRDAVNYDFQTDLDGVMEKYKPHDYEFDVPQRLIDLWKAKDYGPYATADGRMPVAFTASNHTTGGNSGSPALDANGNLIGCNFDRVWEGTMSDLNYDPAICRNIMVDARYILFIIDKYAGAGYLLKEMQLVKGKRKSKK